MQSLWSCLEIQSVQCFVWQVVLKCTLYGYILKMRCHKTDIWMWLIYINWKMKMFLLRVGMRLTVVQMTLLTHFTQWTDSTKCWPAVPLVHGFTGDAVGYSKQRHLQLLKTIPLSIFMLFFFEIIRLLVEETDITCTWKQWVKDSSTAWHDCSRNLCVFVNYCAHGAQSEGCFGSLLVDTSTALQYPLWECYQMWHILSCTQILVFLWQPKRPWQERRHLWPTVENENYIWQTQYAKYCSPTEHLAIDELPVRCDFKAE